MTNTIISALGTLFAPVAKYLKATRTERALSSLSDEMLRDIGIERAQIASISRSAAERDIPKATPIGATLVVLHGDKPTVHGQHGVKLAA